MIKDKSYQFRKILLDFVRRELVFCIFALLLGILLLLNPSGIHSLPKSIDWRTILSLAGLMILTAGVRNSGYFAKIAEHIVVRIHSERMIALFFVLLSVLLATVLTNDITLFIVVPLTISLQNYLKNDMTRLVIFEAMAVNVGSTLTPIGNPQNLFLWHRWNIHFLDYTAQMLPITLVLLALLIVFTLLEFRSNRLEIQETEVGGLNRGLFILSLVMMVAFIVCLELKLEWQACLVLLAVYGAMYHKVLLRIDWVLLALFAVMFMDFSLMAGISQISMFIQACHPDKPGNLYLLSALISQVISNVPASILLSHFSQNYQAIAYGVNVGGQGFLIGSLANLIALRLLGDRKTWVNFHKYSIPFFAISLLLGYWIFFR